MEARTYTSVEAAALIGISRQALYNWITQKRIDAPVPIKIGNGTMRFWSKAQIDAAKKLKGTLKRGRAPKKK